MSTIHQEHHFEEEICLGMQRNGWLYAPDDQGFDRKHFLYTPDLQMWLEQAWPTQWEALLQKHGSSDVAIAAVAREVRRKLDHQGTLHWLKARVEMQGVRQGFKLAEFRPATELNPSVSELYSNNILRVVRQVHHSINNPRQSLDLVLFLNGIPVATVEIKSEMTQSVQDAIQQYRTDRHPHPAGGRPEPLLQFGSGALVHFAVSQDEVYMTTRLEGRKTYFLPFNRGNHGGAGNTPVPGNFPTCYLWEDVWSRAQWLDLLGKYIIAEKDKGKIQTIIFPRYHQLDATRRIVADVSARGAGGKYLIQHSAGSGKTKSIAWTAHFLSKLHIRDEKVFKSVIVISDRTVLDEQLRKDIEAFDNTTGVVASITGEGEAKSSQLARALSENSQIIVCTLQTFPFVMDEARKLMKQHKGWQFAVIADEAHSSMSGDANAQLKKLLTPDEAAELDDGGEIDSETMLASSMASRNADGKITYVAFTATPKAKTMELFGTRDTPGGKPEPFHTYTMRQAIEEGFILDVLQNYTTVTMAWKLGHVDGNEINPDNKDDAFMNRFANKRRAIGKLVGIVKMHPYNISQKVALVANHYLNTVRYSMENGEEAKAMIVLGSRKEAIRWQKAMQAYIRDHHLDMDSLVAFSGSLEDEEEFPGAGELTEKSSVLNPNLKGRSIRTAFKEGDEFQILLVANKFQTGFDEPRLCGMYIDRKLGDVQAVQTLSRLNRCYKGKEHVYVVDFVNKEEDILAAFQPYYETAQLGGVTDPNIIYTMYEDIDAMDLYTGASMNEAVKAILQGKPQSEVYAIYKPVQQAIYDRYNNARQAMIEAQQIGDEASVRKHEEEIEFLLKAKSDMERYIRAYVFLSQITDYESTILEKHYIFYKNLVRLLKFDIEHADIDLSDVRLTHYAKKSEQTSSLKLTAEGDVGTALINDSSPGLNKEEEALAIMIQKLNDLYGAGLSDEDKLPFFMSISRNLLQNELLCRQAKHSTQEQLLKSSDLNTAITEALFEAKDQFNRFAMEAIQQEDKLEDLKRVLFHYGKLYNALVQKEVS